MDKDSEGTDWGAGGSTFAANLVYKLQIKFKPLFAISISIMQQCHK